MVDFYMCTIAGSPTIDILLWLKPEKTPSAGILSFTPFLFSRYKPAALAVEQESSEL
jgi:hypothetical protein